MPSSAPNPRPSDAGDDLIAALRRYVRDRAPSSTDAAIDIEQSLIQFQTLASLGVLASEFAHDFSNVMTVVLGYAELLLAAGESGQTPDHEQLTELRCAARKGSELTERLLRYCGRGDDRPAPLDLGQLIAGLSPLLSRLLGPSIRLDRRIDSSAGPILADARQIEQLVINLVLNARDAVTGDGRVELAVDALQLTAPLPGAILNFVNEGSAIPAGDYVRLRIRDDGVGMVPETIAQLGRPFFTTKSHGTGLGLSIVARVARKTHAAVKVASAPGAGTTFELFFPPLTGR